MARAGRRDQGRAPHPDIILLSHRPNTHTHTYTQTHTHTHKKKTYTHIHTHRAVLDEWRELVDEIRAARPIQRKYADIKKNSVFSAWKRVLLARWAATDRY